MEGSQTPKHPNNFLAFAVICTVVCFAPLGVIALFYSLKVNQHWENGDISKAKRSSVIAGTLCVWTLIAGAIFWLGILFGASYNIFGHKQ